ncbi:hypothetical protein MJO29_003991 [Puccinia striiformis f. sp. tritici]|nr:hypothetical protein MJO29_003991 [Puccinia striiformis f. sp. tritici]
MVSFGNLVTQLEWTTRFCSRADAAGFDSKMFQPYSLHTIIKEAASDNVGSFLSSSSPPVVLQFNLLDIKSSVSIPVQQASTLTIADFSTLQQCSLSN